MKNSLIISLFDGSANHPDHPDHAENVVGVFVCHEGDDGCGLMEPAFLPESAGMPLAAAGVCHEIFLAGADGEAGIIITCHRGVAGAKHVESVWLRHECSSCIYVWKNMFLFTSRHFWNRKCPKIYFDPDLNLCYYKSIKKANAM